MDHSYRVSVFSFLTPPASAQRSGVEVAKAKAAGAGKAARAVDAHAAGTTADWGGGATAFGFRLRRGGGRGG
jgi:hypothetical protein